MGERKKILIGLLLTLAMGLAVYFKLWTIDYSIASNEMDLIRQQFDLANKEAMDESAEWRLKFDEEIERTTKCIQELVEVKRSLEKKAEDADSTSEELKILKKENASLVDRLESLKQELEAEKLKCKLQ